MNRDCVDINNKNNHFKFINSQFSNNCHNDNFRMKIQKNPLKFKLNVLNDDYDKDFNKNNKNNRYPMKLDDESTRNLYKLDDLDLNSDGWYTNKKLLNSPKVFQLDRNEPNLFGVNENEYNFSSIARPSSPTIRLNRRHSNYIDNNSTIKSEQQQEKSNSSSIYFLPNAATFSSDELISDQEKDEEKFLSHFTLQQKTKNTRKFSKSDMLRGPYFSDEKMMRKYRQNLKMEPQEYQSEEEDVQLQANQHQQQQQQQQLQQILQQELKQQIEQHELKQQQRFQQQQHLQQPQLQQQKLKQQQLQQQHMQQQHIQQQLQQQQLLQEQQQQQLPEDPELLNKNTNTENEFYESIDDESLIQPPNISSSNTKKHVSFCGGTKLEFYDHKPSDNCNDFETTLENEILKNNEPFWKNSGSNEKFAGTEILKEAFTQIFGAQSHLTKMLDTMMAQKNYDERFRRIIAEPIKTQQQQPQQQQQQQQQLVPQTTTQIVPENVNNNPDDDDKQFLTADECVCRGNIICAPQKFTKFNTNITVKNCECPRTNNNQNNDNNFNNANNNMINKGNNSPKLELTDEITLSLTKIQHELETIKSSFVEKFIQHLDKDTKDKVVIQNNIISNCKAVDKLISKCKYIELMRHYEMKRVERDVSDLRKAIDKLVKENNSYFKYVIKCIPVFGFVILCGIAYYNYQYKN